MYFIGLICERKRTGLRGAFIYSLLFIDDIIYLQDGLSLLFVSTKSVNNSLLLAMTNC